MARRLCPCCQQSILFVLRNSRRLLDKLSRSQKIEWLSQFKDPPCLFLEPPSFQVVTDVKSRFRVYAQLIAVANMLGDDLFLFQREEEGNIRRALEVKSPLIHLGSSEQKPGQCDRVTLNHRRSESQLNVDAD